MKWRKKLFCAVLSACMLLTICGCSIKQTSPSIKLSEFSKEAQAVIALIDNDTKFFDFTTDESITHAALTVRYCENGIWQEPETITELSDIQPGSKHLVLRWIDDRIDAMISEDGYSFSNQYFIEQEHLDTFHASLVSSTVGFGSEKPIAAGEEIPLWCTYGSNTEEISAQSLNYNDSDCDTGFVIAITFS
ncbi:MAG: hypothetical protein LUE11_05785 [Clostridia bacterium]|nr:hypothetical protein [Clostridia bacterium]